ncbi:hypothetical protein Tco_1566937 [Tanacetum coccineum]
MLSKDSTQTPLAKVVEIKEKSGKDFEKKVIGADKKKMVKRKGKKKAENDDEVFVVEEPQDEGDEKKELEKIFKS